MNSSAALSVSMTAVFSQYGYDTSFCLTERSEKVVSRSSSAEFVKRSLFSTNSTCDSSTPKFLFSISSAKPLTGLGIQSS